MAKKENPFLEQDQKDISPSGRGAYSWKNESEKGVELAKDIKSACEQKDNNTIVLPYNDKGKDLVGYNGDAKLYSFVAALKNRFEDTLEDEDFSINVGQVKSNDKENFYLELVE